MFTFLLFVLTVSMPFESGSIVKTFVAHFTLICTVITMNGLESTYQNHSAYMRSWLRRYAFSYLEAVVTKPFLKIFFDDFAVNGGIKQTVNLQAIFTMHSVNPPAPNNVFVPVLKFFYSNCMVIIETASRFDEQFIKSRIPLQDGHFGWF